MRRSIGNMGEGRIRALPRQSRSLRPTAPRSDHTRHEDDERTMSGIAAPVQMDTLRRVLRLRALNSGPLMMERRVERHEPVMVTEILDALQLQPGMVVVDGTLGLGGHSQRFIEKIAPKGKLIGFDWDESMLALAKERLVSLGDTDIMLVNKDFREIQPVLQDL